MQLLGKIPNCEINSIATHLDAAPTSFVSASSDGFVRYWDTRMKKKDVLAFAVPNHAGDSDILEIVWGAGSSTGDTAKAYTIAGDTLSCLDVRKADVVAQCAFTNAFRVKGKEAGSFDMKVMPVALASFDAALKQHPQCFSPAIESRQPLLRLCDDDGEVYAADLGTCKPVVPSASSSGGATYNGILRPARSKTVSCGFSTFFVSPSARTKTSQEDVNDKDRLPLVSSTLVCRMDNTVTCYAAEAVGIAGDGDSDDKTAVDMYATLKASKIHSSLDMEKELGAGDGEESFLAARHNNNKKKKEICNPPIPACFAPFGYDRKDGNGKREEGMRLAAIGRGDGSYVILDVAPAHQPSFHSHDESEKRQHGTCIPVPEIAFVGQGHAHNTIGTCLWIPPPVVESYGSSSLNNSRDGVPKVLLTIPTSGELTMWDITKTVQPILEEEEEDTESGESDPSPLYASEVRGVGLAAARSLINCGSLLASGKGVLVGTSGGEVLMDTFDL